MTQHKYLPEEPTPDMVKAWCANCHAWDLDAYKAMWKAAPEVEQEPAVYLVWHDGEFTYTKHPEEIVNAYEILTLYTHPQPKQSEQQLEMVKREPLSEELLTALNELVSIVKIHSVATGNNFAWAELEYAAEVIEKAHGIGE